jgi:dephospho-CoA kinase
VIILGLTGGIATGKSTVARMFRFFQIPVFDADAGVHALLQGKCRAAVAEAFPDCLQDDGSIDRKKLGAAVFADAPAMNRLEAILHPAIRAEEEAFIHRYRLQHRRFIVLDIPLLFETGADQLCDVTLTTYCPPFIQWQRAMQRPGMTQERLEMILSRQMKQETRIHRADFVIPTHRGKGVTIREVKQLLHRMQKQKE